MAAAVLAATAYAQQDKPQQEPEVPPPPALRLQGLVPLEIKIMPGVEWGVDPQSLQVTPDGLVRYVAVAQSPSGAVTAFYESIRCASYEVKVHARRGRDGDWVRTGEREPWRPITADGAATRHTRAIARNGACAGPMPSGDTAQVVRELRRAAAGPYATDSR
jgi:hypothetical protein